MSNGVFLLMNGFAFIPNQIKLCTIALTLVKPSYLLTGTIRRKHCLLLPILFFPTDFACFCFVLFFFPLCLFHPTYVFLGS